jgi:hypothetical protein
MGPSLGRADAKPVVRFARLLILPATLLLAAPSSALASQLIDRNATHVSIAVDSKHRAVVSYVRAGAWHHVLVWGAVNARRPSRSVPQVKFHVDYSGGYGSFGRGYWRTIVKHNVCGRYTGPALAWKVVGCTTKSGQNWAVQSWQRELPNSGLRPHNSEQSAHELQVSHWTGALPVLWLKADWVYRGQYDHLYGKFSYGDEAVHGFGNNGVGNPTDSYGRNIYVDTLNPRAWTTGYRQTGGWMRFNGFLAHNPRGNFCAGVFPHMFGRGPAGRGSAYRATAMGPGVTPIVMWQGPGPGHYAPGGFAARSEGSPNYNSMPSGPLGTMLGYSKVYDQTFAPEEKAVAGSGDSCYSSAGI